MDREKRHILYNLDERDHSLKGLWLLALLYFGSLFAATLLSLAAWRITHYLDPEATGYLANKPYPRFFDRSRWLCVLLLLPYLFWQCRISSFKAVGFAKPILSTIGLWFAYGVGMIVIIYGGSLALGAIQLRPEASFSNALGNIDDAILAGIAIGLLEEIVFRGLVFRMFYTAIAPISAIIASSAFFAILHFRASPNELGLIAPGDVGIAEGLSIAWETIASLVTQFDFTYLAAIFLVGILLHQTFLLKGNLWACASLHAGWVFTIKLVSSSFQTSELANEFTGTTRVADGYWVIIVLAIFIGLFAKRLASQGNSQSNSLAES
jgi:membrane protease YdiL (CAAX protease family)